MRFDQLTLGLDLGTRDKTALNLVPAVVLSSRFGEGLWGPWRLLSISAPFAGAPRAQHQLSEEVLGEGVPLGRPLSPHAQQDSWAPASGAASELRVGDEHPGTPPVLKGQDPEMGRKRAVADAQSESGARSVSGHGTAQQGGLVNSPPGNPEGPWRHGAGGREEPAWEPGTPKTSGEPCLRSPSSTSGARRPQALGQARVVRPDLTGSFVTSSVLCTRARRKVPAMLWAHVADTWQGPRPSSVGGQSLGPETPLWGVPKLLLTSLGCPWGPGTAEVLPPAPGRRAEVLDLERPTRHPGPQTCVCVQPALLSGPTWRAAAFFADPQPCPARLL